MHPNKQFAQNQLQRGIRLVCEGEQRKWLLARLNFFAVRCDQCQGSDSGGVAAAAVLVARPDSCSVFVFSIRQVQRDSLSGL